MLYLVSYDIEKDSLRTKVAKRLEKAQLQRIQYSVFLGELNESQLSSLIEKIRKLKGDTTVFHTIFIPLHKPVIETVIEIGDTPIDWDYFTGEKDFLII